MASELKPCQIADALEKCDWAGASIGNKAIVSLAIEALRNTRPAPAATDTGLETVGNITEECLLELKQMLCGEIHPCNDIGDVTDADIELVTRSQAEELLAAERAEREELEADNAELVADYDFMRKSRKKWKERAEKAEAELGFIERVKGVNEKYANALAFLEMGENDDPEEFAKRLWDKREALEAKLAAAEKALEPFAEYCGDHFDKDYDGNPLPDEQKVGWVYLNYGHFRKARAVLGGKP